MGESISKPPRKLILIGMIAKVMQLTDCSFSHCLDALDFLPDSLCP